MPQTITTGIKHEWQEAWQSPGFRRKVVIGMILTIIITAIFPFFFQAIERRNGFLLNDPLLRILPSRDVSAGIFNIIWAICLLSVFRAAQTPSMFLTFVWGWIVLTLFRLLTITMVPLDPPVGLVGLVDPISNFFYGHNKFITRDLFFSGHTSTVFLLSLCVPGKIDKKIILVATFCVGALLLVQHVHYTLDVLAAPFFAWAAYRIARKIVAYPEMNRSAAKTTDHQ
jgi:PAP2 superfamily C-terminal